MGVLQELNHFFSLFFLKKIKQKTKPETESVSNFSKTGFHNLNHIQIIFPGHIGKTEFVLGEKKFLKIQPLQQL